MTASGSADRNCSKNLSNRKGTMMLAVMKSPGHLVLAFLVVIVVNCPQRAFAEPDLDPVTVGGRGGEVIRVTTLERTGTGSLDKALRAKGKRIVVFEVGGVIDLGGKSLKISEPFVTVAGQTAPSPGITLINGGLSISTHDVIVQHLKVRPGAGKRAKKSGWEVDGIATNAASRIIIEHCSVSWSTDENLSASGPRFDGETPDLWRQNTSHHVTISNCIIAEGLSNSTHGKGEHSKGSLLHDNATSLVIRNNLYASNKDRNPLAKGGVHAIIVNNWIANPGRVAIGHALNEREWGEHAPQVSRLAIIGNVFEYGPDTARNTPLFRNHSGAVEVYLHDNLTRSREGEPIAISSGQPITRRDNSPNWVPPLNPLPATKVKETVSREAGARPWDRDPIDARIVADALAGRGKIIDHESEVEGHPHPTPTRAPFNPTEWDLATMEKR